MSGVANGRAVGAEGKARQGRAALGVGMSEDVNARASGAEPQAAGAAERAQPEGTEGGGQGGARRRCKGGRPVREDHPGTLDIGNDVQSR